MVYPRLLAMAFFVTGCASGLIAEDWDASETAAAFTGGASEVARDHQT